MFAADGSRTDRMARALRRAHRGTRATECRGYRRAHPDTGTQKADLLLIRRTTGEHLDERARVLRRLWPLLTSETLVEFKSLARPARRGDWIRLLGYGAQHHAKQVERLAVAAELTLVLVV